MATVTQHPEAPARVRHPLDAVRKYIRSYVLLESAAIVLFVLALWFWIGLFIDYGTFWSLAYDWILELNFVDGGGQASRFVRIVVMIGVLGYLGYLLVNKLGLRLWKEFSDSAVALVLERRFPKELGDRLITAVELADGKKAQAYGFSAPMLAQTINEAAERVERLPVADVFDWGRLKRQWLGVAAIIVVGFLVAGGLTLGIQAAKGQEASPTAFLWRFKDVAAIWFERNILLEDSYWLRNAYLEIVRFQDTDKHPGEMRVGRDEQRPDLIVRAVEWIVPDRAVLGGWRSLKVSDLKDIVPADMIANIGIPADWPGWIIDLDDLETSIPAGTAPIAWQGKTSGDLHKDIRGDQKLHESLVTAKALDAAKALGDWHAWTVDKLLLQVGRPEVRKPLEETHAPALKAIADLEAKLTELAAEPSMNRRLRHLELPKEVGIVFRGATTKSTAPGDTQADHKFSFSLGDLKESVNFFVRGGDFFTPPLKITLVPPPAIKEITIDKEEPAYLYHRVPGDQMSLKGKKQLFPGHKVSVTGETSIIDVPLGSNVVLEAVVDRPIKEGIQIRPAGQLREVGTVVPDNLVTRNAAGNGFSVRFDHVVKTMDFQFEFHDEDNVKGKRRVRLRPIDDQPPEILNFELGVVLRKPRFKEGISRSLAGAAMDGFLITPDANLPFAGTVRDDIGLTDLRWLFETQPIVIESATGKDPARLILQGNPTLRRASLVVSVLQFSPLSPIRSVMAPSYLNFVGRIVELDLKQKQVSQERFALMADFQNRLRGLEESRLEPGAVQLREKPKTKPHLREHVIKDNENFNVRQLLPDLKVKDASSQAQQYHLLKLAVAATDNNVETGPSVSRTRAPLYFLVVPETELLAQIGLEEEVLRDRLEKVVQKLKTGQTTMASQLATLRSMNADTDFSLVALRVDEVRKALLDSGSSTREIFVDYSRILRELEVNNVKSAKITDVRDKVVRPLEEIVHPSLGGFSLTEDAVQRLYQGLDDDVPAKQVVKNIAKHLQNATQTNDQLVSLIEQINAILLAIDRGLDFNEILQRIIALERDQRQVVEPLRVYHDDTVLKLIQELTK